MDATLPSSPASPSPSRENMGSARRCARRLERACCACAKYTPLAFVYGLTSWANYVLVTLCTTQSEVSWLGPPAAVFGITLYLMLNWCYTMAVFTPPGSTTNDNGYSTLPTHAAPAATSFTVKSNGEMRFCKKCQARKPDRAHHCSTCRRCVLKMDHHCPWLATCVGLHNHKAFLLFLIYTTLFSFFCFIASGAWVWEEMFSTNAAYVENLMPVNYIMLCIIAGIIGLVIGAFTGWHIYLATRGQTTIECLEKTRYLSPLRRSMHQTYINQHTPGQGVPLPSYGQQLLDLHQNALPGITRPEEGEELRRDPPPSQRRYYDDESQSSGPQLQAGSRRFTYDEMERHRARRRYEEYLDEQDSSKLPNAFDLGPKRNLLHLFGPNPWLWLLPVCNTTGDGWSWEPNPKWLDARERLARERWEQAERERIAGWGGGAGDEGEEEEEVTWQTHDYRAAGAGRHYIEPQPQSRAQRPPHRNGGKSSNGLSTLPSPSFAGAPGRKTPSKADRVLGRDPNLYADDDLPGTARPRRGAAFPMKRLSPAGRTPSEYELDEIDQDGYDMDEEDDDEEGGDHHAHGQRAAGAGNAALPGMPGRDQNGNGNGIEPNGTSAQLQQQQQQRAEAERRALGIVSNSRWARTAAPGPGLSSGLASPRGFGVGVGGVGRSASGSGSSNAGGGAGNAGDDDGVD